MKEKSYNKKLILINKNKAYLSIYPIYPEDYGTKATTRNKSMLRIMINYVSHIILYVTNN